MATNISSLPADRVVYKDDVPENDPRQMFLSKRTTVGFMTDVKHKFSKPGQVMLGVFVETLHTESLCLFM